MFVCWLIVVLFVCLSHNFLKSRKVFLPALYLLLYIFVYVYHTWKKKIKNDGNQKFILADKANLLLILG